MGIRRRTILAAGLAAAVALPGVALGARQGFELPGWMAQMMDDAPPEMQPMMRSPEMQRMMRSRGMRRRMERPAAMDEMTDPLEMQGMTREAPSR